MKKIILVTLIGLVFIMASCTLAPFAYLFGGGMTSGGSRPQPKIGTLILDLNNFGKTEAFETRVSYFNIYINGEENIQDRGVSASVKSKEYSLKVGNYKVRITAHDDSGKAIGIFEKYLEIEKSLTKSLLVQFDETATLTITLPSISDITGGNLSTSREIHASTNYFRIFIKDADNGQGDNEWQGDNVYSESFTVSNNDPITRSITIGGGKDYRVEVYAQKSDYNPAPDNSHMTGSSTVTLGYGAGEIFLPSGENKTLNITMESFAATAVQATVDINGGSDIMPKLHISFPASYTATRLQESTTGDLNATEFYNLQYFYITEDSTPATMVSVTGNSFDLITRKATLTGDTVGINTFSATGTVNYWFTATDYNNVHFIMPLSKASFEVSDGTGLQINID